MKTETFSFEGKTVTIIGGKGKMGQSFGRSFSGAGANIKVIDQGDAWKRKPNTDVLLFAVNELTTLGLLKRLSTQILSSIPIITTSSTNSLIGKFQRENNVTHLVPIHALCGPNMKGAVMIDCSKPDTLAHGISKEIASVMKMQQESVPLEDHDKEIGLSQARFHYEVWNFVREVPDLEKYISRLPISQRRAVIGNFRVLLRPDISAEFFAAFGGDNEIARCIGCYGADKLVWCPLGTTRIAEDVPAYIRDSEIIRKERLAKGLREIIDQKDPLGIIRDWIRTENERMDQGVPGGPRSFQEFVRGG